MICDLEWREGPKTDFIAEGAGNGRGGRGVKFGVVTRDVENTKGAKGICNLRFLISDF